MLCLRCGTLMPEDEYECTVCGAKLRDRHSDKLHHFTPHGGVMSEVFYFDIDHKPCVKEKACFMEICEYDADGNEIYKFTAHKKIKDES